MRQTLSEEQFSLLERKFVARPLPADRRDRGFLLSSLYTGLVVQQNWSPDQFLAAVEYGFRFSDLDTSTAEAEARAAWEDRDNPPVFSPRPVPLLKSNRVEVKPLRWLLTRTIPTDSVTFLAGDPATGKSTLACMWVAQATRGTLDGAYRGHPINVLWISGEETPETYVVPRLRAYGADEDRISFTKKLSWRSADPRARQLDIPEKLDQLEQTIEEADAKLLIYDPLTRNFSSGYNENFQPDVRAAMEPLMDMCSELDVAVIGLGHFGKSKRDGRSIMGSGALQATVRNAIWTYIDSEGQHFFGLQKGNNVKERPSFSFEIRSTNYEGVGIAEITGIDPRHIEDICEAGDRLTYRKSLEEMPEGNKTPAEKILGVLEEKAGALPRTVLLADAGLTLPTFKRHLQTLIEEQEVRVVRDPGQYKQKWVLLSHITDEEFIRLHTGWSELQQLKGQS